MHLGGRHNSTKFDQTAKWQAFVQLHDEAFHPIKDSIEGVLEKDNPLYDIRSHVAIYWQEAESAIEWLGLNLRKGLMRAWYVSLIMTLKILNLYQCR